MNKVFPVLVLMVGLGLAQRSSSNEFVVEVTRGENDYTLILHLDAPIASDRFTISCNSLRMAGSHLESPPKEFDGPDREK